jgi:hypothetical protein
VSPAYGHHLLGLADRLTYRKLVALAFFAENGRTPRLITLDAKRKAEGITPFGEGLGSELDELGELSLLGYYQDPEFVAKPSRTYGGGERLGDFEGHLDAAALMPTGRDLYELMELHRIPEHETDHIFNLMQPRRE